MINNIFYSFFNKHVTNAQTVNIFTVFKAIKI